MAVNKHLQFPFLERGSCF